MAMQRGRRWWQTLATRSGILGMAAALGCAYADCGGAGCDHAGCDRELNSMGSRVRLRGSRFVLDSYKARARSDSVRTVVSGAGR